MAEVDRRVSEADGVYLKAPDGAWRLVHAYLDEGYDLAEVATQFRLGRSVDTPEGVTLILSRKELRELKALADGFSFDYAAGFIEMCLDMHRAAAEAPGDEVTFFERLFEAR
jgi:hypothetical protein